MKKLFFKILIVTLLLICMPLSNLSISPASASSSNFKDLNKSYVYYDIIKELSDEGLINGYPDGTFRPNEEISIKHAGALVVRALDARGIELPVVYSYDFPPESISKADKEYANMIRLQKAAIPNFESPADLNRDASRMNIAEILSTAFGLKSKADYLPLDIDPEDFFAEDVKALYTNGITTADENGDFNPHDSLTRAHFAVLLHRTLNMDKDFKPAPVTKTRHTRAEKVAKEIKILEETPYYVHYKYNPKIPGGGTINEVFVQKEDKSVSFIGFNSKGEKNIFKYVKELKGFSYHFTELLLTAEGGEDIIELNDVFLQIHGYE